MHEGLTHYPHPFTGRDSEFEIEPTASLKGKFIVNLKLSLSLLMADHRQHIPWSNVPPTSLQIPLSPNIPHQQ
jgi:hypothetical protein